MKGKLIVFEGTDGAGKTTQTRLMAQRLTREGAAFRVIDFPRYGNPFAEPAKLYLNGVLFAVDRYASYKEEWGVDYEAGKLILANRYTTSNAVHQASKLPEGERESFLTWLFDLEYRRLELPEPDLVFYLDLPIELTEQMMRRREAETGAHADIHEQDEAYLRRCRESAGKIADRLGWRRIDCSREGAVRTQEDIHAEAWELVRTLLGR